MNITSNSSESPKGWWAELAPDGCLVITMQLRIYPLDAIARCVHEFTDRAFVFLTMSDDETHAVVRFRARNPTDDLDATVGEFSNRLLDHTLRIQISAETRAIRELIVAQAFVEADLLDREESNATFEADPRGINSPR